MDVSKKNSPRDIPIEPLNDRLVVFKTNYIPIF
jgi:hypothetical protein